MAATRAGRPADSALRAASISCSLPRKKTRAWALRKRSSRARSFSPVLCSICWRISSRAPCSIQVGCSSDTSSNPPKAALPSRDSRSTKERNKVEVSDVQCSLALRRPHVGTSTFEYQPAQSGVREPVAQPFGHALGTQAFVEQDPPGVSSLHWPLDE